MDIHIIILVSTFTIFILLNVPIAFSIGLATFFTILSIGDIPTCTIIAQRIQSGINSFALLAIPFFILAGILMGRGGMATRLINFASALVGRFPGGLSYVNVLTCMLFGAISGSATAAVSSVGGFMIPEMYRKGYDKDYSVAVTTTAATTGLIIPPSNIMIIYALVSQSVSVAAMFMAGILPGILVGISLMITCYFIGRKKGYKAGEKSGITDILRAFKEAFWSLLLIIIVLGGILNGAFTATEAAAIAVVYSFSLCVFYYQEISFKDIPEILLQCAITTSIVMILIGMSSAMSWVLAYQEVPQKVSAALLGLSDNRIVIFLIINAILLIVGFFMDMTPAVLIFTPIFLPVVVHLGMSPVQFGIVMIVNLCIGLCTPPVGTCLFVGCSVGKTSIVEVTKPMIPFFIAMIIALFIITYVPAISTFIPNLLGL
jgi:tripartite ATP-independent transporter DctM subunit